VQLADQYSRGVDAAYSKMVDRVGKIEADHWRAGAINSAQKYEENYLAAPRSLRKPPRGTEES
jgi:hypothetical protein